MGIPLACHAPSPDSSSRTNMAPAALRREFAERRAPTRQAARPGRTWRGVAIAWRLATLRGLTRWARERLGVLSHRRLKRPETLRACPQVGAGFNEAAVGPP